MERVSLYRWSLAAVVALGVAFLLSGRTWPPEAKAAVVGYPENVNVTCATTATPIAPTNGKNMYSVTCKCDAAVAFGAASVDSSTDYSDTTFSGNVRSLYCDAASDTSCRCIALVAQ